MYPDSKPDTDIKSALWPNRKIRMPETTTTPSPYTKRSTVEAEELTDDMTAGDLIFTLEHMRFAGQHRLVSLDRGVRDFLVRKLKPRTA